MQQPEQNTTPKTGLPGWLPHLARAITEGLRPDEGTCALQRKLEAHLECVRRLSINAEQAESFERLKHHLAIRRLDRLAQVLHITDPDPLKQAACSEAQVLVRQARRCHTIQLEQFVTMAGDTARTPTELIEAAHDAVPRALGSGSNPALHAMQTVAWSLYTASADCAGIASVYQQTQENLAVQQAALETVKAWHPNTARGWRAEAADLIDLLGAMLREWGAA